MREPSESAPVDWSAWHRAYDDADSSLSRRLRYVQQFLRDAIDAREGPIRIVSMCAGEGRDVIGVLAEHPRRAEISARLVELDPRSAAIARTGIERAGLAQVEVLEADAGLTDSYAGAVPAEIVLACGVFGNVSDADVLRTVQVLPCLCAPGATVLWTRGRERDRDFALTIRRWFGENGFEDVAYAAPDDAHFRVGSQRLLAVPRPFDPRVTFFRFTR